MKPAAWIIESFRRASSCVSATTRRVIAQLADAWSIILFNGSFTQSVNPAVPRGRRPSRSGKFSMKQVLGLLAGAASIASAGAAHAQGVVSANIALTSDYVFRGVSLSDGPAVQGGFDYTADLWYAGVWGSSVVEGVELDLYAGFTPTTGPIEWDFGVIGYFYPDADDDGADYDYAELLAGASTSLTERLSVGGAVYYAPENWGDTGEAIYLEINGEFAVSDAFAFSGAFGNQTIEDPDGPFGLAQEDDYNSWNFGAAYAFHGFQIDLRYHDTDIDAGSDIEAYTYGPSSYDSTVVLTIGREL